ncbi:hypothetical protein L2E82_34711 [Cichorium intybus]|uniref:Uncharacterized protein n=1 Tax=Cichorium intybus TaxID=13427 RepID=A0ACB9BML4_CICIN|nr:hypothetical protein L2E82_34711 [Cichorium intybus]
MAEKKRESENQIKIRYPKGIQESYDTVTPNSTSSSLKRSDLGIGNYESLIEARIISAMVHLINHARVCQNGILSTHVQINKASSIALESEGKSLMASGSSLSTKETIVVMQLGDGGEYSLVVHHSKEEMQQWVLSPEMIADQKCRANAPRGGFNEKCRWYLDGFFDHLDPDSKDGENEDNKIYLEGLHKNQDTNLEDDEENGFMNFQVPKGVDQCFSLFVKLHKEGEGESREIEDDCNDGDHDAIFLHFSPNFVF